MHAATRQARHLQMRAFRRSADARTLLMPVTNPSSCTSLVTAHRAQLAGLISAAERTAAAGEDDEERVAELRSKRAALARQLIATAGPRCRDSSQAYLEAINALQRADAYDPYLHREWGLALRARGGRSAEAEQHIAVAAALFEQALAAAAAGHDIEGPQMLPGGEELTLGKLRQELAATRALLPAPAGGAAAMARGAGEL